MKYKITPVKPFGVLIEPKNTLAEITNLDIKNLRHLIGREQLIVLRGFTTFTTSDEFANYCERWGEVSVWPFGKVLELIEQANPKDHIFDNSYVPLHWDGMYRPQVPELQLFHCVKAPLNGHGGRTTFSNTVLALSQASSDVKKSWEKVTGTYERKMEFYSSKTVSPIIDKHPYQDYSVIRYNEPHAKENGHFVNPPGLEFTGASDVEAFHQQLKHALYSPHNFYAHEWQTGDVVIADNFSLLHGREAFVSQSPRHIQRVHVLSNPPFNNPGLESYQ